MILGLGSFLYIICGEEICGEINVCYMSKMYWVNVGIWGRLVFDINMKFVVGE